MHGADDAPDPGARLARRGRSGCDPVRLGKATLVLVGIFAAARFVLPGVLRQVANLRIREVFTVTVVLFSLGTAWIAERLGLSLAIGALLAGLVISESEHRHQVFAEIVPFRDIFSSLFFISIGMLLRFDFLAAHAGQLLLATVGVIALKIVLLTLLLAPLMSSFRMAFFIGACLAQVGELAFVLARAANTAGLLSDGRLRDLRRDRRAVVHREPAAGRAGRAARLQARGVAPAGYARRSRTERDAERHVLIIGYGLNGRNLARVLRETGVSYRVLEFNARSVEEAAAARRADRVRRRLATDVLHAVGVGARADHRDRDLRSVEHAPHDGARARHERTCGRSSCARATSRRSTSCYRLGATEVIPEEFETSVEIFARVLRACTCRAT